MNKLCTGCGQERDAEQDFSWKHKERGIRNTRCKICQSQISKKHYENNKQAYGERARTREILVTEDNQRKLVAYFSCHPCVDCGQTDIRVLEFDHVHGNKSANITKLLKNAVPWKTIASEIAKCEVRCVNCHRIKTLERGNWWRHHLQIIEDLFEEIEDPEVDPGQ